MPMKWPFSRTRRQQEQLDEDRPFPSRTYGFVRGRELEGTYPGPPNIGSWILTTQRVAKGWGHLPDRFWPYVADEWPPIEPPGVDQIAKAARTRSYMRCRTLEDCRKILDGGGMVLASFEIDDSWTTSDGLIDDPRLHRPQTTHSVVLIASDQAGETLRFSHNWGPFWGDAGFGDLPYQYWSDRLLEAWIPDEREAAFVEPPADSDFLVIKRDAPDPWGHQIHLIEIEDPIRDEMMGWTILRHSGACLELEEFFVRPSFRRRGHGRRLARAVVELRASLGVPLSAWIPHVDASPTPAQDAIFRRLRLERAVSTERWAAGRAVERKR
jgi:GNAT superfamily N-acetyltransferase